MAKILRLIGRVQKNGKRGGEAELNSSILRENWVGLPEECKEPPSRQVMKERKRNETMNWTKKRMKKQRAVSNARKMRGGG